MRINKTIVGTCVALVLTLGVVVVFPHGGDFAQTAQTAGTVSVAVGSQYDTAHVYVAPEDFDRLWYVDFLAPDNSDIYVATTHSAASLYFRAGRRGKSIPQRKYGRGEGCFDNVDGLSRKRFRYAAYIILY